jgi:tetratricopeptide (TPR) repeat protein
VSCRASGGGASPGAATARSSGTCSPSATSAAGWPPGICRPPISGARSLRGKRGSTTTARRSPRPGKRPIAGTRPCTPSGWRLPGCSPSSRPSRASSSGRWHPARALDLSKLSIEITARLDPAAYGESRIHDLGARAWAGLGNAQRIRGHFREAEDSFARSERLLRRGTGDPLEKANVLLLKASLRGNQQRFREAFRLLDRVLAIGRKCGDPQLCGKALVMRGFFLSVANDPEAAIRHLTEGVRKVDPATDARLLVAAQHNLILVLAESGRYDEAMRLLESARPLYHQVGDQMSLLRLRWLEGKIGIALGQFAEAEELLRGVRIELIERELGFDVALLSLDLANIYTRQGRSAEMRRLAEEMLPIFKSRDIHREALAALLVFQKAAEMERVTLGLIREVSSYLKETRATAGAPRSREIRDPRDPR